jgi:enoyl-CoA hydratase/carnithine racemase
MLIHCDFVLLADDARRTTPFVSLALVPEAVSIGCFAERMNSAEARKALGAFAERRPPDFMKAVE